MWEKRRGHQILSGGLRARTRSFLMPSSNPKRWNDMIRLENSHSCFVDLAPWLLHVKAKAERKRKGPHLGHLPFIPLICPGSIVRQRLRPRKVMIAARGGDDVSLPRDLPSESGHRSGNCAVRAD